MKKRTLALLAFLIALIGAYFVFIHSWNGPDNEFQITDTKIVGKIEIEKMSLNKTESKVLLEREADETWKVNGKYLANESKIIDFLTTLRELRVREPIEKKGQISALSILKRNHSRVRIWDRESRIIKDYLIGATNSNQTANIFKMDFSDRCYLVSKPALDGYVSIYYSTNEIDWRDKTLWTLKGNDLKGVELAYLKDTMQNSFTLHFVQEKWLLDETQATDGNRVRAYLSLFDGKINAESFADTQYPGMRDSLARRQADAQLTLDAIAGSRIILKLFARPESQANFFAYLEGTQELLTVQHYVIDPFLKGKSYFAVGLTIN